MSGHGAGPPTRLAAVDWIKASALLAVVLTHAGRLQVFVPGGDFDLRAALVKFGVPAFLAVSGFLTYRAQPVGGAYVGRRLRRILVPYALASLLMDLAQAKGPSAIAFDLLVGAARPEYYYVPVFCVCMVLSWPLSRMPGWLVGIVTAALCGSLVVHAAYPSTRLAATWFWSIRDPTHLLPLFLAGWLAADWRARLARPVTQHRAGLAAVSAVSIAVWLAAHGGLPIGPTGGLLRVLYTFGVIGMLVALTRDLAAPKAVRFLSDASLGIYLYHGYLWSTVFHVLDTTPAGVVMHVPVVRALVPAGVMLLGGAAICLAGRRLLGRARARLLLGA